MSYLQARCNSLKIVYTVVHSSQETVYTMPNGTWIGNTGRQQRLLASLHHADSVSRPMQFSKQVSTTATAMRTA